MVDVLIERCQPKPSPTYLLSASPDKNCFAERSGLALCISASMRSFALALAALPALASASVSSVAYAPAEGAGLPNGALQNILKNTDKTDKYRYPTDFTRGIEPVRLSLRQDFFGGCEKALAEREGQD